MLICYLTRASYGACHCRGGILSRVRAIATASWLETCTRGPSHQRGAARKLPRSVLFSTLGRWQFQDLQPRDVDTALFLACAGMLAVAAGSAIMKMSSLSDTGAAHIITTATGKNVT